MIICEPTLHDNPEQVDHHVVEARLVVRNEEQELVRFCIFLGGMLRCARSLALAWV